MVRNTMRGLARLAGVSLALLGMAQSPIFAANGILGTYYTIGDVNDKSTWVLRGTRIDSNVDFGWGDGSPGTVNVAGGGTYNMPVDNFAVVWTGQVITTTTGLYRFTTRTDDGGRLLIAGAKVVPDSAWRDQGDTDWSGTVYLVGGMKYDIQMEQFEHGGGATARMRWTPPGSGDVTIPNANLLVKEANTVASPTISPTNALINGPVQITMASATPGATIRYTTDGTAVTPTSPAYNGPFTFTLTGNQAVITAQAFKNGLPDSSATTVLLNRGEINYPSGFATHDTVVTAGNGAFVNNRARLSGDLNDRNSAFWSSGTVGIQSFSSVFTFQIVPGAPIFQGAPPGEGMTFAIQGNSSGSVGEGGSGLGFRGLGSSLGIKFDIADNSTTPPSGSAHSTTGLYLNGANPTGGATQVNLLPSNIDLRSGQVFRVNVGYNGSTLTVTITNTSTNATSTQTYNNINIPAIVGGSRAFVGFTGSTSLYTAVQEVLTWTYTELAVPDPTVSGTLVLGDGVDRTKPVTLTFRPTAGGANITRTVNPAANGTFSTTVPAGNYNLAVTRAKAIRKVVAVNTTGGSVTGLTIPVLVGDSNGDNNIDALDLADLITAFNTAQGEAGYNASADFNDDNSVDALDLATLIDGFNAEGDL